MFKQGAKILVLLSAVFVLTGCSNVNDGLKAIDQGAGQLLNGLGENKISSSTNSLVNKETIANIKKSVTLTDEQKKAIDAWLEKQDFNRYGDAKNAIYTGGTPLFDEKTGQAMERYDYILKKFPDILQRIKQ